MRFGAHWHWQLLQQPCGLTRLPLTVGSRKWWVVDMPRQGRPRHRLSRRTRREAGNEFNPTPLTRADAQEVIDGDVEETMSVVIVSEQASPIGQPVPSHGYRMLLAGTMHICASEHALLNIP